MSIFTYVYLEEHKSFGDGLCFHKVDNGKTIIKVVLPKNVGRKLFYQTENNTEFKVQTKATETNYLDYLPHCSFNMENNEHGTLCSLSTKNNKGKGFSPPDVTDPLSYQSESDIHVNNEDENMNNYSKYQDSNKAEIQQPQSLIQDVTGIRSYDKRVVQTGDQTFWFERYVFEDESSGSASTLVLFHYKGKLYLPVDFRDLIKFEQVFLGSNIYPPLTNISDRVDVLLFGHRKGELWIEIIHAIDREVAWVISKEIQNFNDIREIRSLLDVIKPIKQFSTKKYQESEALDNTRIDVENNNSLENSENKTGIIYRNTMHCEDNKTYTAHSTQSHDNDGFKTIKIELPHNARNENDDLEKKTTNNNTNAGSWQHEERQKMNSRVKFQSQKTNFKPYMVFAHDETVSHLVNHYFSTTPSIKVISATPMTFWPSMHPHLPDTPRYLVKSNNARHQ